MRGEDIVSGELLVIGEDSIQIPLKKGRVETVLVEFKEHCERHHHHPCNPHRDEVEWEIHRKHHGLVLEIRWDVESPRAIVWAVSFH